MPRFLLAMLIVMCLTVCGVSGAQPADSIAAADSTADSTLAADTTAAPDTAATLADSTLPADSAAADSSGAADLAGRPGLLSEIARFFREGGIAMWPILLFLAIGLAISVERFVFLYFQANIRPEDFMARVADLVRKGSIEGAIATSAEHDAPLARIIEAALRNYRGTERDIQNAVDEMALAELPRLNARLSYLAVIANVATMTGLLGTIFGLIQAFGAVSVADPETKGRILANGIAVAMNTTAFGLIVAIPTLIIHSFLSNKSDQLVDDIDRYSVMVINMLAQARKEG
ncbi:MotA/TolQ/ExbB proton channel family protein [Candidatus Fermentibacteria bacterium]|nr:MotA/TolQ/ExbB proton channel family protein [Candidatus Fermentibacteria bacterium]